MFRKLRGVLVLGSGITLGLLAALGSGSIAGFHPPAASPLGESTDLLVEVIDRVRREYVDGIDDRQLAESAIRGVLAGLDEHSDFLDAARYEDVRIATSGNYTGIGLDVSLTGGKVTVIAPLADAPASRAGILPGDVVVAVNDVRVEPEDVATAVDRMRGAPGTEVTLDVLRRGSAEPLRFALKRAEVRVQTVSSAYLSNGLGYLRIATFAATTPRDLAVAARELAREAGGELLGVVLDVRSNPGGLLESAVAVADIFLTDGLIVRGSGRGPQARFEQYAHRGGELEGVPAVVLVNGGSASASEIVAGALQDHGRAAIVGERTYGKGSVQTVMPLRAGAAIKLTTSRYVTPAGRMISDHGIEPNVVVAADDPQRQYRGPSGPVALGDDPQLLEAVRLISYASIRVSQRP